MSDPFESWNAALKLIFSVQVVLQQDIGEASDNIRLWNIGPKISKEQKLLVFERKILRIIFGPTKERDGTWRIKKMTSWTNW
jgi:hypothetical protein